MSKEFRLPDLGENITEGEVIKLLVKEGDIVKPNQTIMELETDKALLEVPTTIGGKITKVHVTPGTKLKINGVVLTIEEAEATAAPAAAAPPVAPPSPVAPKTEPPKAATPPATPKPAAKTPPTPPPVADPVATSAPVVPSVVEPAVEPADESEAPTAQVVEVSGNHAPAAPSTRKLARELGVDLTKVKGTGPGGRISAEDVRSFVKGRNGGSSAPAQPARVIAAHDSPPLPDFAKWGDVERKKMSGIRRKTMEHLTNAWRSIPHVTQVDEADVTELENLRERHSSRAVAKGGKLTATVFVMKAVVAALKEFPQFNASIDPATEEIIYKSYYNLGIAVDTDHGLLVPVIRGVDRLPLLDLSAAVSVTSEKARQRKVTPDDLSGGTFTITNLGGIGGTSFTPIINWPEVAILGLARYQKRLVLKGDRMETRIILPLCLSYDHRLIDGADGARFTRKVATMLEDPAMLLLEG